MYEVRYVENGENKVEKFEDSQRDEAFRFQTGLLARSVPAEGGGKTIETLGVWKV